MLRDSILEGAVGRVRPKMMTVMTMILGLLPVLWSAGAGALTMKRIAVPMIGGLVTSTIHTLLLIPLYYELLKRWELRRAGKWSGEAPRSKPVVLQVPIPAPRRGRVSQEVQAPSPRRPGARRG